MNRFLYILSTVAFVFVAISMTPVVSTAAADALENLKPERLEAVRQSVAALQAC